MRILALVLIGFAMAPAGALAHNLTAKDVKRLAIEAILENPEIIAQVINDLGGDESESVQLATISNTQKKIIDDADAIVLGNPNGDVTLIEFFDYNCGYCKRAARAMQKMIVDDKNLRVVLREWPILSQGSQIAARASLAARNQDKYEQFHWALMKLSRANEASIMKTAAAVGLDVQRLKADMHAPAITYHLKQSNKYSQSLGLRGTPAFIIGDKVVAGFGGKQALVDMVQQARHGR